MSEEFSSQEITSDDRLWAALGYTISVIAIIVLFMEEKKNRPFIKFHAVQALILNVALYVVMTILGFFSFGVGFVCIPLVWLVTLWPAYDAYRGNYTELPYLTNFIKNQGWV